MPKTLTVTEMARSFAEYINRVAYRRESFVLTRGNKPVAELKPLPIGRKVADLPGILASVPHLAPEDVELFAKDLRDARREANSAPVRDPWED